MNERFNNIDTRETIGPSPLLRDVLVEATFAPGRRISDQIDSIDLGAFQDEARVLANETFIDDENSVMAKLVYASSQGKVLVPKRHIRGVSGLVIITGGSSTTPKELARVGGKDEKFPSMIMHTQSNNDRPYSGTGMYYLMEEDSIKSIAALFIAGKTQNMLFFRGAGTPQWNAEEGRKRSKLWITQLNERFSQHVKPGMDKVEAEDVIERAEHALLKQVCEKYDVKFFKGPTDSPIVVKQFTK